MFSLSRVLCRTILDDERSISEIARKSGVPQATLQEFVFGKADGTYSDIRLSAVERLLEFYGISVVTTKNPKRKGKTMRLDGELKYYGCTIAVDTFKERLVDLLIRDFPETTIDGLVCEPANSSEYCHIVRDDIECELLPDKVILKALMNIRRAKQCPVGLRRRVTRNRLVDELQRLGTKIEPLAFRDAVLDSHASMYKDITIDEILCSPKEAASLCVFVRRKCRDSKLPDELILRTLQNSRKSLV